MNWENVVKTCVKWIGEGDTFAKVERTLKGYGYTLEQREEIMQMVADEVSRRKKGNAAD